ncbi:MAG TPA: CHAT domain-containing protein [Thermoanaerobaculia bacterium]|nr:CHAT domain-containing protein [Thermoanaerobaculia bacterium]
MRRCPDPGTFGAFLEDSLPSAEYERVFEHIDACPVCHQVFAQVVVVLDRIAKAKRADEEQPLRPARRAKPRPDGPPPLVDSPPPVVPTAPEPVDRQIEPPAVPTSAAPRAPLARRTLLAAAVALAVGLGFLLDSKLPTRDPRVLLMATEPRERPWPARFRDVAWSPVGERQPPRTTGDLNLPPGAARYLVAAELRGPMPEAPSAQELAAIGAEQALGGQVDPGVATLMRAVAAEPEAAELLSELGAARLARAESSAETDLDEATALGRETHDEDVPAALEAIELALEKSPQLHEALFNRALALEALHLPGAARRAWQRYLAVDPHSKWAREARERLARLAVKAPPDAARLRAEIAAVASDRDAERLAALVQTHRYLARRVVQEELLPGWGEAHLSKDVAEATRQLNAARAIAEEYEAQTSDGTLRRAVEEVERSAGALQERLAAGYLALGESARAHDVFDLRRTRPAADRALTLLPPESPAAIWARTFRLVCAYYANGDVESEANAILDGTETDLASRGRALWILGLFTAAHGDLSAGIAAYQEALLAYQTLEETDPSVWLRFLIGEAYGHLGASGDCWRNLRAALRDLPTLTDRGHALSVVLFSAIVALREERPRAAAGLLDEALEDPELHEPNEIAIAYVWRGRMRLAIGAIAGAREDFLRASIWSARSTPVDAEQLAGDLRLLRGLLARDPSRAVEAFTQALESFRAAGQLHRVPEVLLHRSEALLRAGEVAAADADLRQGVILSEQQAGTGAGAKAIWSSLRGSGLLYDKRVELLLRERRWQYAVEVAEAGRGWDLGALVARPTNATGRHRVEPLSFSTLQAQLEPGVTVLFYSVLPKEAIVWRVQQARLSHVVLPISPDALARLATAVRADLTAQAWTATTRDNAMRLYEAIVSPAALDKGELVIVPDGELHGLPFAALVNPVTGKFLVEETQLTVAPSVEWYVRAHARWRTLAVRPPSGALVVGDPTVTPGLLPGLKVLPGARSEARQVAGLYSRRQLLLGATATRGSFVEALGRHDVIHFAGHAITNAVDPSRSSLPLADDAGHAPLLFAADIPQLNVAKARTVVLSGCETGVGPTATSEGSLSLTRAFLAAGVPTVVASLWPISDGPSAPLAIALHHRLRAGEPPASALRGAQLELLRGQAPALRNPAVWAALEAFGG